MNTTTITAEQALACAAEHGKNARHLLAGVPGCLCHDVTCCEHGLARVRRAHAEAATGQLYAAIAATSERGAGQ